ncbi:MAG: isopentenyl-diphosphate delta-isomerase [Limisphaerales bacterium]
MSTGRREIVSNESEHLILVDSADGELGTLSKSACHDGPGILHRAFSLFIFNPEGELLIQQRAADKRLWPSFWSNSCCSHPRSGESLETATQRRCQQELGFTTPLQFVYKFEYHAEFGDLGAERELCSVFVGAFDGAMRINQAEISAHRWIAPHELDAELAENPERFTPWFHLEWASLRNNHPQLLPA